MIHWLTDPYQSQFMQHAGAAALIVGVLSPTVGVWIVLRRLAHMGDAMSHATLSGVAAAYLLGFSIIIGALIAGVAMGVAVAVLGTHRRLGEDAIIGIVETGLFAMGVILITSSDNIGIDLSHFLFGQITTVSATDLVVSLGLAAAALVGVFANFDDLRMTTFDPLHAAQVGVRVGALRLVLLSALSITIVVCLSTVGILMSIAMLVVPAAAARMVTRRVTTMTATAIVVGVVSSLGGLTLSYHLGSPPGATIALVAVAICLGVFAIRLPRRVRHHPVGGGTGRGGERCSPVPMTTVPAPSGAVARGCLVGSSRRRRPGGALTVLVCRACCCGTTRKHPEVAHRAHLARLEHASHLGGGHTRVVGCLGSCSESNVVVVVVRRRGARARWIGERLLDVGCCRGATNRLAATLTGPTGQAIRRRGDRVRRSSRLRPTRRTLGDRPVATVHGLAVPASRTRRRRPRHRPRTPRA